MSASLTAPPGGPSPPPGGAPPSGGPGAAPIGSSSATGPSQNLGATAQGNQIAAAAVQLLTMALTKVPPGTSLHKAISKAQYEIGKEIEPGAASPAGDDTAFKNAQMQRQRMQSQLGAQATHAGTPGAAMPPKPPMPAAPPPAG